MEKQKQAATPRVAKGNTVNHDGVDFGPGQVVPGLPSAEVERLIGLGVLTFDEAVWTQPAGPTTFSRKGPQGPDFGNAGVYEQADPRNPVRIR